MFIHEIKFIQIGIDLDPNFLYVSKIKIKH
jgi:hypothetical protein